VGAYQGSVKLRLPDCEADGEVNLEAHVDHTGHVTWGGTLQTDADLWTLRGQQIDIVLSGDRVGTVVLLGGRSVPGPEIISVRGTGPVPFHVARQPRSADADAPPQLS
jgi:hypothetical protein